MEVIFWHMRRILEDRRIPNRILPRHAGIYWDHLDIVICGKIPNSPRTLFNPFACHYTRTGMKYALPAGCCPFA